MVGIGITWPLSSGLPELINGHFQFIREEKIHAKPKMLIRRIRSEGRSLMGGIGLFCRGRGKAQKPKKKS
jgi:hypothetical protein